MSKHANISDKTYKKLIWSAMFDQTNRYPGGGNIPMPLTRIMIPVLTEAYGDQPEVIVDKEMRYLNEYFNTESTAGELILGAMCAIEASKVDGASDISNALKISLMAL